MKSWHISLLLFLAMIGASNAFGQGCSLCRDTTAGSAPQVRKSLRLAIPILAIPAAGMFTTILYYSIARKTKPQDK